MKVVGELVQWLCLAGCLACAPQARPTEAAASTAPWFANELGISRPEEAAAALKKPFDYAVPVVRTPESSTAGDCAAYFKLNQEGYSAVSDQDFNLLRMEGVRCHALRLGATLKPVAGAHALEFVTHENALDVLPASVGGSASPSVTEARRASAKRGESWRNYANKASVSDRDGIWIIDEGDTTSELTLLASGDLDGDHQPEFILRVVSFGREGSWRDIHLAVLKRKPNQPRYEEAETIAP